MQVLSVVTCAAQFVYMPRLPDSLHRTAAGLLLATMHLVNRTAGVALGSRPHVDTRTPDTGESHACVLPRLHQAAPR